MNRKSLISNKHIGSFGKKSSGLIVMMPLSATLFIKASILQKYSKRFSHPCGVADRLFSHEQFLVSSIRLLFFYQLF
jgi:uncharacterized membrane protein